MGRTNQSPYRCVARWSDLPMRPSPCRPARCASRSSSGDRPSRPDRPPGPHLTRSSVISRGDRREPRGNGHPPSRGSRSGHPTRRLPSVGVRHPGGRNAFGPAPLSRRRRRVVHWGESLVAGTDSVHRTGPIRRADAERVLLPGRRAIGRLILDRHVVLGRRPPPGGEATALCGRVLVIGPGPFEAEPGVPALGHRNCWDCQDVILGVTPEPPERQAEPVRLVRTAPRAGSVVGATRRVVHVCSADTPVDAPLLTRCGTRLSEAEVETVAPGVGMPCSACLLAGDPPPQAYPLPDIGRAAS